jgi:hypothetical protein
MDWWETSAPTSKLLLEIILNTQHRVSEKGAIFAIRKIEENRTKPLC